MRLEFEFFNYLAAGALSNLSAIQQSPGNSCEGALPASLLLVVQQKLVVVVMVMVNDLC